MGQGRSHLRAFQMLDQTEVIAVCDVDEKLARRVAAEEGVPRIYTDYDQLLEDKDVDIIVVATPDHLHGRHALQGLLAGKHVLSEISMALTLEECERIIEITDKTGLKYHMGNQVRYANCLVDVKRMISEGKFGEIFYGEGEYLHNMVRSLRERGVGKDHWRIDPRHPQTTLLGGGPHAIDTLRWLMGVRFVEAKAYNSDIEIPGWPGVMTTVAIFKGDNGSVAKVTVSYGMARPYCLYFSIYGTKASFERTRIQDPSTDDSTNYLYFDSMPNVRTMIPVPVRTWNNPAIARRTGVGHGTMEIEQAMDFIEAIVEDKEPSINPREAARSCAAGICALKSAETGTAVAIPTF